MNRKKFLESLALFSTLPLLGNQQFYSSEPKVIKPKRLQQGAKVGIAAPGSSITEIELNEITSFLQKNGYSFYHRKDIVDKKGYLAGNDNRRADEINEMFADTSISAVLFARGGYGCMRILDLLDYELIKNNPKIIIGYSDITAILAAIFSITGLVGFHGPVGISTFNDYSMNYLKRILIDAEEVNYQNPISEELEVLNIGTAQGTLIGGNLSIITALVGTKYLPSFENKILFLEEIGEEPYRVDRMLIQLKLSGELQKLSGILIGAFTNCDAKEKENSLTLTEVFEDILLPFNIPILKNLSFGHITNKFTLPFGIKAKINTKEKTFNLLEPAVI